MANRYAVLPVHVPNSNIFFDFLARTDNIQLSPSDVENNVDPTNIVSVSDV